MRYPIPLSIIPILCATCQPPPPEPIPISFLPPFCETKARLARPPGNDRSISEVLTWAKRAANTANQAIAERDACAINYLQLRNACAVRDGCKVSPLPPSLPEPPDPPAQPYRAPRRLP